MTPTFFTERQQKALHRLSQIRPHWQKPEQQAALNEIEEALTDNLILVDLFQQVERLYDIKIFLSNENKQNTK